MKVFVIGGITGGTSATWSEEESQVLQRTMKVLGRDIVNKGHDLLVCSPFQDSADFYAIEGALEAAVDRTGPKIEIHHPDWDNVNKQVEELVREKKLTNLQRFSHPAPPGDSKEGRIYGWLLSQLYALDSSTVVITVGGKLDGPMNLLLALAPSRGKFVLPLRFLGGAAAEFFERRRHEIQDALGAKAYVLGIQERLGEIVDLLEILGAVQGGRIDERNPPKFFISYARRRPKEADFVETVLRRRNLLVFRDEQSFEPGQQLRREVTDHIFEADIFVAIWCREYACSPWCIDELDVALDRHGLNRLKIWILCVDDTRIVPRRARGLLNYPAFSREHIEGTLRKLIENLNLASKPTAA